MRTVIIIAAAAVSIATASPAHADPGSCFDSSASNCGGHQWNGPLQQTWDTPGFYGGMTGGNQLQCDPFTYQCHAVATP